MHFARHLIIEDAMRRATAAPLRICIYSMPVLCLKICGVKLSGGITFSTVACAGASENAQAGTLPKNIWPQDLARQGGAIAFFLNLFSRSV